MSIVGVIILVGSVVFFGPKKMFRHWLVRVAETLLFYKECTLLLSTFTIAVFIIIYITEFYLIIAQNIWLFVTITIPFLIAGVGWAARSVSNRRKERKEIVEKVNRAFRDVAALKRQFQLSPDEKLRFYSGEKIEDRFWEIIIEELDFRRSVLSRMEREFDTWDGKFHQCKIPIGEKQGKSILAGRFAWELAKSSENKVLWWKGDTRTIPMADLPLLISRYRRYLSKTKKLVVLMDDLFGYEGGGEDFEDPSMGAYYFLQEIDGGPVFIVYPSRDKGQLKLENEDLDSLINKLIEKQLIDKAFAEKFSKDARMRGLYKDQLCRCMNLVAIKSQFMPKSQSDILARRLSSEEDEVFKKTSLCTIISLPHPEFALQNISTGFWREIETGVLGSFLKEEEFETGEGIYDLNVEKKTGGKGHVLAAPVFAIEILRERYRIQDLKALSDEFEKVLYEILSSAQDRFQNDFAMEYARVAFCRLANNLQRPFYPEFRGLFLAQAILAKPRLGKAIAQRMDELTDLDRILRWAFTFRWISNTEIASKLMAKAEAIARERGVKRLDLRQVIQLAIGLKDASAPGLKERAAIYFENAIGRIFQTGTSRVCNQVIDAYIDLTTSLKGSREALDKLDELLDAGEGKFKPDAILIRRRAQLLDEMLDKMPEKASEAQKEFRKAITLARTDAGNAESLVISLQRYGVFLSQREALLDPSLREDPEVYFKEAAELAKEVGFGYEAVLNAWAVHKEAKGGIENIEGARSLYEADLEYCDQAGVIHPPSLLGFARFLHKYGRMLKEKAWGEWWQMAEDCCRKVINYEEADHLSRLHAYHQLGLLIGSAPPGVHELPNGNKRPDFPQAVSMIERAFESPQTQRVNESQKTFQDCVTHRSLAQIYSRWIDAVNAGNVSETEPVDILLQKVGFHSFQAFSGLSQRPNLTRKMKEHIVESQIGYAGFQRFRNRDPKLAKVNYDESIKNLEHWGLDNTSPRLACRSYWYVGNFYSYLYKISPFKTTEYLDYCEQLYRKALNRMPPNMPIREKSRLRFNSVTGIYKQMQHFRLTNDLDTEKQKHAEASRIIEEGLAEDPRNSWLWSGRVLLSLWENNLDFAVQQLIQHQLSTLNQCLMTLSSLDLQAAAREICTHLNRFQDELKEMLIEASTESQCLFFSKLSALNKDLGSAIIGDPRIREELRKKLDSSTATSLAKVSKRLVIASRMEPFLDICMSLDYSRIINSSTLPSIYRVLARFVEIQDASYGSDKKNAGTLGAQLLKALRKADLARLTSREDATLFRLNGIIYNATKLDKIEAVRLVESLSDVRLNPLFLKVDPVAQGKGISQAEVVSLFISGRASVSLGAAAKIVDGVPEHDFVYLINAANEEGNVKGALYLLWNIYRFSQPKAMRLACSVAEQLQRRSCDELEVAIIRQLKADSEVAQQLQSRSYDEPILIRLAIFGLLRCCNVMTRKPRLSDTDLETLKKTLKERRTDKRLTLPLLSLIAAKAELGREQFRQVKEVVDWEFVNRTIQVNEDQNLRVVLSSLAKVLANDHS
jgi:hypothetical protein